MPAAKLPNSILVFSEVIFHDRNTFHRLPFDWIVLLCGTAAPKHPNASTC